MGGTIKLLLPFISIMEKFTVNNSTMINLVSEGFFDYFTHRYKNNNYVYYPNGIDSIFIDNPAFKNNENYIDKKDTLLDVLYAGNIGDGQGLDCIIPYLANHFKYQLRFIIIGSGAKLWKLKKSIHNNKCNNVKILNPLPRTELIEHYQKADILFLHLNNLSAFNRVLPSKLFEYSATNKPIWAGVSGNTKKFIKNNIENVAVFEPCDIKSAINSFKNLLIQNTNRKNFCNKFDRIKISKNIIREIRNLQR